MWLFIARSFSLEFKEPCFSIKSDLLVKWPPPWYWEGQRIFCDSYCNTLFLCLCFATKSSAKTDKIEDSHLKVEESTDVMDIFKTNYWGIPAEVSTWNIDVFLSQIWFISELISSSQLQLHSNVFRTSRWVIRAFLTVSNPTESIQGLLLSSALITVTTEPWFPTQG